MATSSGYVVYPLACADACFVAAFATLKCEELYAQQTWHRSLLTPVQRCFPDKYPAVDFAFWVKYGSWSRCSACGSFYFNDKYFSQQVYQDQVTSATPDLLAPHRASVPTEPVEHEPGLVGVSSRWWYLPGMFRPSEDCTRCTPPPVAERCIDGAGPAFARRLRLRGKQEAHAASQAQAASRSRGVIRPPPLGIDRGAVQQTRQLYRIPRLLTPGSPLPGSAAWAAECVTWPRLLDGVFRLHHLSGESMLELTDEECHALQIVVLRTEVRTLDNVVSVFSILCVLAMFFFSSLLICKAS